MHTKGLVAFQMRSTGGFNLNPNKFISLLPLYEVKNRFTYPKYITGIDNLDPVLICHLEHDPWYVLDELIITAQCSDGAIHVVSQCQE